MVALVLAACGGADDGGAAAVAAAVAKRAGLKSAPTTEQERRTQLLERGRYLVSHVAACPQCHSPQDANGLFDQARWLSGMDCYVDFAPDDPNVGCLSTRNLTHHETGLKNRSDREIKDMLLAGERPDGKALHPFMPYRYFANMRAQDADAIVAYLRTVPGVERTAARSQPPFLPPDAPAPPVAAASIPLPRADYADQAAALRGRYLAGEVGICLDCHTPRSNGQLDMTRAFQGGLQFPRAALGLPAGYPEVINSANLTPHATGILGYSVAQLVRVLKQGIDRHGTRLCPPMPAGPAQAFGGLHDDDASDIAHYLLSLPPGDNAIPNGCQMPSLPDAQSSQPFWLSATGLYSDIASKRLADDLIAFEPAHPLWTDGADKRRWLRLPAGTRIDTSDMDHWRFPVGSMLFKEFARDGRRIETRVLARTGEGEGDGDYWLGAFVWNDDESDALFVPDGRANARGTEHDVPSVKTCSTCHNGEPGRVLGFSAVQQPQARGELLGAPPARPFAPPGDASTAAALGYLHGNCAHCHNPGGSARPDSDMGLRLAVADRRPQDTQAYRTAIGRPATSFRNPTTPLRVAPGQPEQSALLHRMRDPSRAARMPPLGSERVDRAGSALVETWIRSLSQ
jgi:mono/diheme cytochrome c family protein